MTVYANAKINLSLDVVSKRDDGYHEVCMIMQEIDLCDEIRISQHDGDTIELRCDGICSDETNIAYKAAKLFYESTRIKALCRIELIKSIPVCAGLGGGSSDAAGVLMALNEINNYPLSKEELLSLSLKLGADVPFFIYGGTCLAEGIGEKLTPLNTLAQRWVVLIKPDIDISTARAYAKIDFSPISHPDTAKALRCIKAGKLNEMYKFCGNSFEDVTKNEHPEIQIIKNHMYSSGAEFAMMSGSGPTVFGIFDDKAIAEGALSSYKGSFQAGAVCKFK